MINTIVCTRINQRDLPLIGSETGDRYLLYRYLSLLFWEPAPCEQNIIFYSTSRTKRTEKPKARLLSPVSSRPPAKNMRFAAVALDGVVDQ